MARPGLRRHVKYLRLCSLLSEPAPHVLGHLELLWETAYECGNAIIGDTVAVELAAEWEGEPGKLCRALQDCGGPGKAGFIEPVEGEPGVFMVHDLFDHAPSYVAARAKREAERRKPRACTECGAKFRSTEPHARYCCHACRQASYRKSSLGVTQGDAGVRHSDADVTQRDAPPAPAPAPKKESKPAGAGEPPGEVPAGLLGLIDGWNFLGPSIVAKGNGARRDPPAQAVLAGWHRAQRNPEQREAFQDIPVLMAAIQRARFCHLRGWFTLAWLFGKNGKFEYNVSRILAGGHNGDGKEEPPQTFLGRDNLKFVN